MLSRISQWFAKPSLYKDFKQAEDAWNGVVSTQPLSQWADEFNRTVAPIEVKRGYFPNGELGCAQFNRKTGKTHISLSLILTEADEIRHTLAHELVHAAQNIYKRLRPGKRRGNDPYLVVHDLLSQDKTVSQKRAELQSYLKTLSLGQLRSLKLASLTEVQAYRLTAQLTERLGLSPEQVAEDKSQIRLYQCLIGFIRQIERQRKGYSTLV